MKFKLSEKFVIDSEEQPWSIEGLRIGFFGGSGSGKSWSAALLVEQWLAQGGTVVVFEPRAEYQTLKEKFDVLVVGGPFGKDVEFVAAAPSAFAHAIVNDGVSIVFYTSDVEDEEKLIEFVRRLINYILKYNEVVKRPVLIVIEEAQEYAPSKTSGRAVPPWVYARMIRAFKNCFEQGRKLNVSTIALSPRPQGVDFTIRQLANLSFYGKFSPQDIGYIDRECLKVYRERGLDVDASRLLDLRMSEWLVIHGKIAEYVKVTEKRVTPHGAVTPKLKYEVPKKESTKKTMNELVQTIQNALQQERLEESEVKKLKSKVDDLERELVEKNKKIEELKTALTVAGALKIEAVPLEPKPVPITVRVETEAAQMAPPGLTTPSTGVPHLTNRRCVGDAVTELLKTDYCYRKNGLTSNEIHVLLKQNGIPHSLQDIYSYVYTGVKRGEFRRDGKSGSYRYWAI